MKKTHVPTPNLSINPSKNKIMKSISLRTKYGLVASLVCIKLANPAHAATVSGPSGTLNSTEAGQIQSWINEGEITFTRIFSKQVDGGSAATFHALCDGVGSTVSILTLSNGFKIGGYNPQSWNSNDRAYNITPNAVDWKAFIFNVGSNTVYRQFTQNQTYSFGNEKGPIFGSGFDLVVEDGISSGATNLGHAYGDSSQYGQTAYLSLIHI